jgi:hypothetical protein
LISSISSEFSCAYMYIFPSVNHLALCFPTDRWRITSDLKTFGKHITDKQALEIFQRRSSLSSRISTHRNCAALFLDILLDGLHVSASIAEETDGRPELARLYMPSQLGSSLSLTPRSLHAKDLELKLRRVTCLRALSRVRTTSIQKAQMITSKQQQARGEVANTRAQTMIARLSDRVDLAMWEYENSRKALGRLAPSTRDTKIFKELTSGDLKGLSSILKGQRELGEGSRALPWFWVLRGDQPGQDTSRMEDEVNEGTITCYTATMRSRFTIMF